MINKNIKKVTVEKYISIDGKVFYSKAACLDYEGERYQKKNKIYSIGSKEENLVMDLYYDPKIGDGLPKLYLVKRIYNNGELVDEIEVNFIYSLIDILKEMNKEDDWAEKAMDEYKGLN